MEAPYEIWLIGQAVSEGLFKEYRRRTDDEAYLSYKLTSEPSAQVSKRKWKMKYKEMLMYTWLSAFAEHDVKVVPAVHSRKAPRWKGAGAIAYPAIVVTTTKPARRQ